VVTLAIWGEVTSGATLTICSVWGNMVDVITCAIFGDCRLRGVGVVRGENSLSPIDLTRRPYNMHCDAVAAVQCKCSNKKSMGRKHNAVKCNTTIGPESSVADV